MLANWRDLFYLNKETGLHFIKNIKGFCAMNEYVVNTLNRIRRTLTPNNLNMMIPNLHFGETEAKIQLPALETYADKDFTAPEKHSYYEVAIQLEKHTLIQIGSQYYDLMAGQLCIIPPNTWHRIKWSSSANTAANMMWISVTGEIVRTSYTLYSEQGRSKVWGSDLRIPGHFLLGEIFSERDSGCEGSAEAIVSYVNAFLSLILQKVNFRSKSAGVDWTGAIVTELQEYIKAHLGTSLNLADLSTHVSLSPNYLCKIFKQVTGETITHYTQNQKIERSIELLKDDSLSIGEIAERFGFCDQFYFSKVFKSYMCISPMQYRKSLREQKKTDGLKEK